jgi:hypothetical protein
MTARPTRNSLKLVVLIAAAVVALLVLTWVNQQHVLSSP